MIRKLIAVALALAVGVVPTFAADKGPVKSIDEDAGDGTKGCGLSGYGLMYPEHGAFSYCDLTTNYWKDAPLTTAMDPYINVMHPRYGCAGDGVTNDDACFTEAFAACTDDRTIFLPAGDYLVTDLTLPDGCSMVGVGTASSIHADAGTTTLLTTTLDTGIRIKRLQSFQLVLEDIATTGLKLVGSASWLVQGLEIINIVDNDDQTGSTSNKCLHLEGTQNSIIEISEFKRCDYGIYLNEGAANNTFIKNEVVRSGTAHLWATDAGDVTGNQMHGNTFINNLYERDRIPATAASGCPDGAGPLDCAEHCGPDYGIALLAGKHWKFYGDGVNQTTRYANWYFLGPDAEPTALGGASGVLSVFMNDTNTNMIAQPNSDPDGDCSWSNDWTTTGAVFAQGVNEVKIDEMHLANSGNTKYWVEGSGYCSTALTDCCTADDCPPTETCEGVPTITVDGFNRSDTPNAPMVMCDGVGVVNRYVERATQRNWLGHKVGISDPAGAGNDQLIIEDVSASGEPVSIRLKENDGADSDFRLQATSGQFVIRDIVDSQLKFGIGTSTNGFSWISGQQPAWGFRDSSWSESVTVGWTQMNCVSTYFGGPAGQDAGCELELTTYDNATYVNGLTMETDYTDATTYTTVFTSENGDEIFTIEVTP